MIWAWPRIHPDYSAIELNRRNYWLFHVPLVVAGGVFFSLPVVREWTGIRPLPVAGFLLLHLLMFGADNYADLVGRLPRAYSTFAVVTNLVVTASPAAFTGRPQSPFWALYLIYPHIAARAFGLNAVVTLAIVAVPFGVAGAWSVAGVVALRESLGPASLAAFAATCGYLLLGQVQGAASLLEARKARETGRQAAEEERRRIAGELHSTLGSALTEVALWQEVAAASAGPEVQQALARAHSRTRAALDELRASVGALRGSSVAHQGLEELLRKRVQGLCEAAGIGWELSVAGGEDAIEASRAYHAAKVVEEAVLNAVRHGRAQSVRVEVCLNELRLVIADDGCGFDLLAIAPGHGLEALRVHAEALGGRLQIDSGPAGGTCVSVLPARSA